MFRLQSGVKFLARTQEDSEPDFCGGVGAITRAHM
jgi:hypothetical protein